MTFVLRRAEAGLQVGHVIIQVPGQPVVEARRGTHWRTSAAVDELAAAIALLQLKQRRGQVPELDSEMSVTERTLIERCSNAARSAASDSSAWTADLFASWLAPSAAPTSKPRNLLPQILKVSRRHPAVLRLAHGRLLREFGFTHDAKRADDQLLDLFVTEIGGAPQLSASESRFEEFSCASLARVVRRVKKDNVHDRPCVAVLGRRLPNNSPADDFACSLAVRGVALVIAVGPQWHLIVRTQGIGLEVLEQAFRKDARDQLTYSVVPGSRLDSILVSDLIILIGGDGTDTGDLVHARSYDRTVLPLVFTGGLAAFARFRMPNLPRKLVSALEDPQAGVASLKAIEDAVEYLTPMMQENRASARVAKMLSEEIERFRRQHSVD